MWHLTRFLIVAALAAASTCLADEAQVTPPTPNKVESATFSGEFCATPEQALQFARLVSAGTKPDAARLRVNTSDDAESMCEEHTHDIALIARTTAVETTAHKIVIYKVRVKDLPAGQNTRYIAILVRLYQA